MVTVNEHSHRSSDLVEPLSIQKERPRGTSAASKHDGTASSRSSIQTGASTGSHSHITPPTTPNGSQEDLSRQMDVPQPVFHNFLRAFYPFHPSYAISDSTVTLPLNEGDVILVHSIHTNGWADGTLLVSGARGWLPTNYCEAYDPDSMRNLLQALLNFWDLLRSGVPRNNEIFANQEFMRGIIAGVRYLLEKSNCLTRESPLVQSHEVLRRHRKALLSDLSSLVKNAKRLQESMVRPIADGGVVDNITDEMILKAFKIVVRGVKFLDVLEHDIKSQAPMQRIMAVVEEACHPPTPPAESTSFESTHYDQTSEAASRRSSSHSSASALSSTQRYEEQTNRHSHKRSSCNFSANDPRPLSVSQRSSLIIKRQSVSHRLSVAASIPASQRQNFVSERLNASHDTFLSYLGSFIGRLHLQSQSSADLLFTIRQSVTAGQQLLMVVEAVCAHDKQSDDYLTPSRTAMYDRINKLVSATREIIQSSPVEDDDVVMTPQNGRLLVAATGCVKAAGECVAKTKFVIERIGDFEFEAQVQGLGIDVGLIATASQENTNRTANEPVAASPETVSRAPPRLTIPGYEKPLPDVPLASPPAAGSTMPSILGISEPGAEEQSPKSSNTASSTQSTRISLLPPLPKMSSPLLTQEDYSPSEQSSGQHDEFHTSFRVGSLAMTSGTNSTYLSSMRDSESSMVSHTSTRATTPDNHNHPPRHHASHSVSSVFGGRSMLMDDSDDGESKMLEKTYAHELLYNKEGQITGGSLPALVERLTTHDSTPDAMFVSTFYLTFRLFATPVKLAKALVDRFDYVAQSPHIAGPVRLRVYNVFKGWLESHWRNLSDEPALVIIKPFAQDNLGKLLPAAGRRLLELAEKVSSTEGPLVPRQVSSMGKTSTSISQYIPSDTPLPPSNLSKSQLAALKNWKMGGSNPTILDFDPLELARQLTLKEMNIFSTIMPEELLGSEWTKRSGSNAVNVRAMSTLSTDLSNLVADTILQYDDVKKRATVIKHWIKIAQKCLELNNYDSLMAIICSLNSSTILRLKRTWDMVSQKRRDVLNTLQTIVEPDKNYAILRRRLHDHVPPCLPFVGTYLTDLTFVDAGNPSKKQLPGNGDQEGMSVINFDKHTRTAKIIGELQRFQIPYRLAEVSELQEWIQASIVRVKSSSDHENVQQYYRKSLLLEPREYIQKISPTEIQSAISEKEKFDLFSWTHSKAKSTSAATPI